MDVEIEPGVRLWFDVEGSGLVPDGPAMNERPTLLLLHGGPGFDHSSFKPDFARFADTHQVIYYDHRGQGRSDRDGPDRWNLAIWGDDVVRLCDALGIREPVVCGQSFGGHVALSYATRHPGHASRLILSSTNAAMRLDRILAAFLRIGGDELAAVAQRFWTDPTGPHAVEYIERCMPLYNTTEVDADGQARTVRSHAVTEHYFRGEGMAFDMRKELGTITGPVLLLAGEQDPVTTIDDMVDLAESLSGADVTFERFPDCGHGVFRDDPDGGFAAIRRFLEA